VAAVALVEGGQQEGLGARVTDRLTSRKFLLAVLVVICATGLCAFGRVDATVYGAIVGGVVATYLTANVTQKAVT
jgi:hypothetical protein